MLVSSLGILREGTISRFAYLREISEFHIRRARSPTKVFEAQVTHLHDVQDNK